MRINKTIYLRKDVKRNGTIGLDVIDWSFINGDEPYILSKLDVQFEVDPTVLADCDGHLIDQLTIARDEARVAFHAADMVMEETLQSLMAIEDKRGE